MLSDHKPSKDWKWLSLIFCTLAAVLMISAAIGAKQTLRRSQTGINPGQAVFDPNIEAIAKRHLEFKLNSDKAESGFVIVADPQTGKVFAAVNIDRTKKERPHSNWSLSEYIEPASMMKGLIGAYAIEKNLTYPDEVLNCEKGNFPYDGRIYHDWMPFDKLTTAGTIAQSSNICGMKLGIKIGGKGLRKALSSFGLGEGGSASTFPGARSGSLPYESEFDEKKVIAAISTGYTAVFKTTALEMVQAFGAIANGGNLMEAIPYLENGNGRVIRRVLSPQGAQKTKEILVSVVNEGTGKGHAQSNFYSTAGKTATSYSPNRIGDHKKLGGVANVGSFIGFAPVSQPRVEIYVSVTLPPHKAAHGSSDAGPIFKNVAEEVLKYLEVPPDK